MNTHASDAQRLPDTVTLGIGTWAWGDSLFWGYGKDYDEADVEQAFTASLDSGITFFDTAEVYGFGTSEQLLGRFIREAGQRVMVATKFMPYPWRFRRGSLVKALRKSLARLGLEQVELYQMHWPSPPLSIEAWMDAMADAVVTGLTHAVGVSNFNTAQTERAHRALAKRDVALASNQVEYSLLNRKIEQEGLMNLCRDLDIKIIAYSPLGQGLLTGKYTPGAPPPGIRGLRYRRKLKQIEPLLDLMREIGAEHGDKSPAQVALNWVIAKGAIPIPGAKTAEQARQNAGAAGWSLTPDEVAALDETSHDLS